MARMTQAEIIRAIARDTGLKNAQVTMLLDALKALAIAEVRTTGEFVVPGFGRLVKVARGAREGRNPSTGEVIAIPAKTVVKFRIGRPLIVAVSDDLLPDEVFGPIEETAEDPAGYSPEPDAEAEAAAEEYWDSADPPAGGGGPFGELEADYAELPGEFTKEGEPD